MNPFAKLSKVVKLSWPIWQNVIRADKNLSEFVHNLIVLPESVWQFFFSF